MSQRTLSGGPYLNSNLFSSYYLDERIGDLDGYQPPSGVADSDLAKTTESLENLRIGDVEVEEDGDTLTILATARYKPADEEAHETDPNGYYETDPLPAMIFNDLSEAEHALIREFVPYAVDVEIAGFREQAAKTISPIDRLESITLPALADVVDGLNRYIESKERAIELDDKIHSTDELIDRIVYRLYGLTDEEIEIVEEVAGN